MPPSLLPSDTAWILQEARVPEHSVPFMEAMSEGTAFVENGYLFLTADDWLMAVAYPLTGNYSHASFETALEHALATAKEHAGGTACVNFWAIGPELPPRLHENIVERDSFYTLPVETPPPGRLKTPLARAATCLRVDETRAFTPAHRRLWAEFMGRTQLKATVRELFARTESVLKTVSADADLRLLNAWDAEGHLAACLLLDYTPHHFCSYVIGAHSHLHTTPYAADLLFSHMLVRAKNEGKTFVHLGLGVNDGIRRFKTKWGGVPSLPYVMAEWEGVSSPRHEQITAFMKALRDMPPDLSKRQIMASLPEQRPFAMLWELEKNGRRSWIGGTAHFFCYSFERHLRTLFEQVDTVLFEGPLDPESLDRVDRTGKTPAPHASFGEGQRLGGLLTEEELLRLEKIVQGPQGRLARLLHYAHPNPTDIRFFLRETRHWCAFFSLWTAFLERQGWRQSVDLEAWQTARNMGKTVLGMETLEEQIASLECVPVPRILRFFRDCTHWNSYMTHNVRAYLQGDLTGMMGTSTEFPSRTSEIINDRDQRFRERMRPFIEQGRCAVFVGAAHMIHLRGMLRDDGFTVRQVLPTWKHRLRARWKGAEEYTS